MDWSKGEYDAWVAGWLLGKYEQYTRFPTDDELDEWLEGFKTGTAEVGEFHLWKKHLATHINGKTVSVKLLTLTNHL
jgi:hypothetical protein